MKIYPVIHYYNDEKTIKEAQIAKKAGADGVFLISHVGLDERLIPLAVEIKNLLKFKVGINLLPYDNLHTAHIAKKNNIDMVWFDNCGVSSGEITDEGVSLRAFSQLNKDIDIFASVAFKYQNKEKNPVLAASNALSCGFIPTTSGDRTGHAPSVDKIKSMFDKTGTLAIASGMTVDNVNNFKNYLSHILVSTGVSKDDFSFDEEKLKEFIIQAKS